MSLRTIDFNVPYPGPIGASAALGIILTQRYGKIERVDFVSPGGTTYRIRVREEDYQRIADEVFALFPLNHVLFLDVDAGVHFALDRQHRRRTTGDDR